jgi:hypothetical protein
MPRGNCSFYQCARSNTGVSERGLWNQNHVDENYGSARIPGRKK